MRRQILRVTKSPHALYCWWERHLPLINISYINACTPEYNLTVDTYILTCTYPSKKKTYVYIDTSCIRKKKDTLCATTLTRQHRSTTWKFTYLPSVDAIDVHHTLRTCDRAWCAIHARLRVCQRADVCTPGPVACSRTARPWRLHGLRFQSSRLTIIVVDPHVRYGACIYEGLSLQLFVSYLVSLDYFL